jgi:hydroxymethylpyrimidine/phosphomethylpyrimidine kinase
MASSKQKGSAGENAASSVDPGPRVLAVGGSDPSGAAGIQADLKTLNAFGVFGAAAITAITVQDQRGVTDVMHVPASLVAAQMDAAFSDSPCEALKTGMLATVDIVHQVADRAQKWGSRCRIVVDPVLASSSGRSLLADDARSALIERLIPAAAIVTPNIPEATLLTGVPIATVEHMSVAADHFLALGASAVLIKGGHLVDADAEIAEITDLLRTADGEELRLVRERRPGVQWRGTG